MIDLFGTRAFVEARNEFRAALQCGAREIAFLDGGDAVRLLAAASNGIPISLGDKCLDGLRKGKLRLALDWARLFVTGNGVAFPEALIVRENGTAMFVRRLPGFPGQATLDVTEDCFNEWGDGLREPWAGELDRLTASLLLNPWVALRPPAEGLVEFHEAHREPGVRGQGPTRLLNGAAPADLLLRPVTVSLAVPDSADVERARAALMALLDSHSRSRASHEHLYGLLEDAGQTDVSDAAFEAALDSLPKRGQDAFCGLVDVLIDAGYEWDGFVPRPRPDWTYRGDWAAKWADGRKASLDLGLPKYQRLLRAWEFVVRETARLLDLNGWDFTPGLLVGDEDNAAELSEWGGRTFALLNIQGVKVSAALGETVLVLRDRAAHIVAHVGQPSHDERWARRYGFLLEETAPLLAGWQRELSWLSSYGASVAGKNGG